MLDRGRVRQVFARALELPEAQRGALLDRDCAGDRELRDEVESLLGAAARRPNLMVSPTLGGFPPEATEAPGTRIGPYKLLEPIGQGGFGTVYLAEQDEPVRRRVALKIIKLGMDTRAVIARFEAERQALAMMDHAHIAKVLDAGATASGRPFFVMELVRGEPITRYADGANLSIEERLDLFVQVCQAVQHAHSKGIIHRDIKPGNVLVAEQDGRPHAKVIDFGIAKATDHRLTERTLFTEFRQLVGTPEYMSPEQAGGAPDVDTRSDVYSLGVLLYELLTGATPFDARELRSAAYAEIQRIIREVEPPKPSTRLSRLDTLPSVAAVRRTEPGRLSAMVTGDLDWIVMKALEKDRARRYETPSALAADLRRHMAGEPVTAAPPSIAYRLRKFVRRNRGPVFAGGAAFGALVIGLGLALWQAGVARQERDAQRLAAAEALAAKAEAEANRAEAEQVAEFQASQLHGIDVALMGARLGEDLLAEAERFDKQPGGDPTGHRAEDLRRDLLALNLSNVALEGLQRNVFERAIEAVDKDFGDRPLVQARLLATTGRTLAYLGMYDKAIEVHQRALKLRRDAAGEGDARTLESLNDLGNAQIMNAAYDQGEASLHLSLQGRRRIFGEDAPETLATLASLASSNRLRNRLAEAEAGYREVLGLLRRTNRPEDIRTLERVLGELATTLLQRGTLPEAEQLSREALAVCKKVYGDEGPRTLTAVSNLATVLHGKGDLAGATALAMENLEVSRRVHGDKHPSLLSQVNNVGVLLTQQRRFDEAEPFTREAHDRLRARLGEAHRSTLIALNNLGILQMQRERFGESAEMLGDGARIAHGAGEGALEAMFLHHRADALRCLGRLDDAKPDARAAVEMYAAHTDWTPLEGAHAVQILDAILVARGDSEEREAMLRAALERVRQVKPPREAGVASALAMLGTALIERGKFDEAEPLLREAVEIRARTLPERDPGRWRYQLARSLLGGALAGRARDGEPAARVVLLREAEPLVLESYAIIKDEPALAPSKFAATDLRRQSLQRIVDLYETWGAVEPGKGYEDRAREWREKLGPGAPAK